MTEQIIIIAQIIEYYVQKDIISVDIRFKILKVCMTRTSCCPLSCSILKAQSSVYCIFMDLHKYSQPVRLWAHCNAVVFREQLVSHSNVIWSTIMFGIEFSLNVRLVTDAGSWWGNVDPCWNPHIHLTVHAWGIRHFVSIPQSSLLVSPALLRDWKKRKEK